MNEHVKTVCKIGQGKECCRYLTMGPDGLCCEKKSSLKTILDQRVASNSMTAQGDNCEGKLNEDLRK